MSEVTAQAEHRFHQALSLLRAGRFSQAWPLYEARKQTPGLTIFRPTTTAREWRGEDLRGKRLAVCPEQGFGDQIMWGRYLPLLAAAGAELLIVSHPRLMRLFETLGYRTWPAYTDRPIPQSDFWAHFGSVPLHLGGQSPPAAHYLHIASAGADGGIGVLAEASQTNRSLREPFRSKLLALGTNLDPAATGAFDFLDTAQIIAGLDLVISVNTAVVNLAAALGRRTWVLLPPGSDFRWGLEGRSPWYPAVTQYRLTEPGDWQAVIDNLASIRR